MTAAHDLMSAIHGECEGLSELRALPSRDTLVVETLADENHGLRLALGEARADVRAYREILSVALAQLYRLTQLTRRQRESLRAFVHPNLENDTDPDDEATL